jgi:putative FmdB family regulatory protein
MPTYDYACRDCGRVVEVMHRVNDTGPTRCEHCGGPMRKLISPTAIVFKGSGWAKNDARTTRTTGAAKGATEPETDHRPAAAPESSPGSQPARDSKPAQPGDSPSAKPKSTDHSAAD